MGAEGKGPVLRRHKRNWISAPRHLKENQDYTGYEYIARVRLFLKGQHADARFHLQDSL